MDQFYLKAVIFSVILDFTGFALTINREFELIFLNELFSWMANDLLYDIIAFQFFINNKPENKTQLHQGCLQSNFCTKFPG